LSKEEWLEKEHAEKGLAEKEKNGNAGQLVSANLFCGHLKLSDSCVTGI
jgi:hypothetical protein